MLNPRTTIDATRNQAKLDALQAAVQRAAEGAEADPFDQSMVAAVAGAAEAMMAQADALPDMGTKLGRVTRRAAFTI